MFHDIFEIEIVFPHFRAIPYISYRSILCNIYINVVHTVLFNLKIA